MRVLVTGCDTPAGKLVVSELLGEGDIIREFGGLVTDQDACRRQARHVDRVVHCDWLHCSASFEAHVDHNLGGSIKLAVACEERDIPIFYAIPDTLNRSIEMAMQVLRDEYGARDWWNW